MPYLGQVLQAAKEDGMNAMKTNPAFQRALDCLTHPVSLAAASLLLLNALVFQRLWPSWWTGKIGDAAWLVFVPFLVAAGLSWSIPSRWPGQRKLAGLLALSLSGLGLALVKTMPSFNASVVWLFKTLTGYPPKLALDPTDLLVLPALLITWWLWNSSSVRPTRFSLFRWAALGLAVLAITADSAAPQDLGITCLGEMNTSLLAFQERVYHGEFGGNRHEVTVYQSEDGGLSWRNVMAATYDPQKPPTLAPDQANAPLLEFGKCGQHTSDWQLPDPTDTKVLYAFIKGQGVYRSEDGGQTLRKEADLADASVLDARIHSATGNVIVAIGFEGLMVRTPDGKWQPVAPHRSTNP
jgi:hypothetical protein